MDGKGREKRGGNVKRGRKGGENKGKRGKVKMRKKGLLHWLGDGRSCFLPPTARIPQNQDDGRQMSTNAGKKQNKPRKSWLAVYYHHAR